MSSTQVPSEQAMQSVALTANGRPRKSVEHTLRHGALSMLRSAGRRALEGEPGVDLLEALATMRELEQLAHELQTELGRQARREGISTALLGDALGISQQAAAKRFACPDQLRKAGGQPAHLR